MTRRTRRLRSTQVEQTPFRQIVNPYQPFEILSEEQVEPIHSSSMDILEDVGIEIQDGDMDHNGIL